MAAHEEDLIDYSDEEIPTTDNGVAAPAAAGNDAGASNGAEKSDFTISGPGAEKAKGSYVGVHSTGFRDFLLRPELMRAITDCGFEHPSEG